MDCESEQIQKDLRFLLQNGWKLIDVNTVQFEDIITDDICRAAYFFRIKLELQEIIKKNYCAWPNCKNKSTVKWGDYFFCNKHAGTRAKKSLTKNEKRLY